MNSPDKYRPRGGCRLTGACLFLWGLTDASGLLLGAPAALMTTPFVVPAQAAFLTLGCVCLSRLKRMHTHTHTYTHTRTTDAFFDPTPSSMLSSTQVP